MPLVECRLSKIVMSENQERQVLVLEQNDGKRSFPIVIGFSEVWAIHRFVSEKPMPRPLTHELIGSILRTLSVSVERVIVNDLRDGIFFARLILSRDGKHYDVDSRPSDAIAMAVQMGAPIFVEEQVLDKASQDIA